MARPREFDEESVLNAAMDQFWMHGYEATSIRDLAEQTGLTVASLYNAFGDKRSIYRVSLERYIQQSIRVKRTLYDKLSPMEAIESFFRDAVRTSVNDRSCRGCMLVNAALEVKSDDPDLRAIVAREFSLIETFFLRRFTEGQSDGSFREDIRATEASKMLLSVFLGLRVLARSRPQRSLLEGSVRSSIDSLRA